MTDSEGRTNKFAASRPWLKWYKSTAWQKTRAVQLAHSPLCEQCISIGMVTQATQVHHVEAHKGDYVKFLDGPFSSLCVKCHSRFGQREDHGKASIRFDAQGWPT